MRRVWILALGLIVLGSIGSASPAYADVAPPQNPPGASIKSGQDNTQVRMVSENVLMTISDYTPTDAQKQSFVAPFMRGHVDATFIMQNQGSAPESFDVWFPTGADTGMGRVATVDNFTAYVDGVQATQIGQQMTKGQFDQQVPWATWPATFPPGQQVTLRVTYDTFPTGYAPYGRFGYILETGAGWAGTIGEGTVTYRFPYPVNELNAAINDTSDYYGPHGGPFSVSGTDVVWHFTDLEPTADNNIALTALAPGVWTAIQSAQADADANANSAQAQLDLANALSKGLEYKYGLLQIGGSQKLFEKATAAYEAALRLDPNKVDSYLGYLDLLSSQFGPFSLPDAHYMALLDRAIQLAPDNAHLQELKQNAEFQLTQAAGQGTFVPTVAPATAAPAVTLTPTPQEVAQAATPTAAQPTVTPVILTPPPATPSPSATGGVVIGVLVLFGVVVIGVALGIGIWLGRRSKG